MSFLQPIWRGDNFYLNGLCNVVSKFIFFYLNFIFIFIYIEMEVLDVSGIFDGVKGLRLCDQRGFVEHTD